MGLPLRLPEQRPPRPRSPRLPPLVPPTPTTQFARRQAADQPRLTGLWVPHLGRFPEAVEAGTEGAEGAEEVLEGARLLEVARRHRLVAGVADELLGHLPRLVVGGVEHPGPLRLLVDLVVEPREVEVERLRDG